MASLQWCVSIFREFLHSRECVNINALCVTHVPAGNTKPQRLASHSVLVAVGFASNTSHRTDMQWNKADVVHCHAVDVVVAIFIVLYVYFMLF